MIRRLCIYDDDAWQALLDESIDDHRSRELSRHLESCDACRQRFESIAAPDAWWKETATVLTQDSTLWMSRSMQRSGDAHQGICLQHYLQPSKQPNTLGCIGLYSIQRILGTGGMGVVFEAFDPSLHRTVAIKIMHPHFAVSGAARQRFAREAKAAAAVMHPNVVPIHAVVADSDLPYLVMSYIPGESLQERLDRDGPLAFEDCLTIAAQIADGLAAAHANGLVHRDIKPANILLEQGTSRVWLTDFGLARTIDDATVTASGFIAGTPQYMSPEQANGATIDHRSDVFSLGSVLYTMVAGRVPFRADSSLAILRRIVDEEPRSLNEIRSATPLWLEAIVRKLQHKSPDLRFSNAQVVRDLLRQCALHLSNPQQASLPDEIDRLQADTKHQFSLPSPRLRGKGAGVRGRNTDSLNRRIFSTRNVILAVGCIALFGWLAFDWIQVDQKEERRIFTTIDLPDDHPKNPYGKGSFSELSRQDLNSNSLSASNPSPPAPLPEDGARGAKKNVATLAADGARGAKENVATLAADGTRGAKEDMDTLAAEGGNGGKEDVDALAADGARGAKEDFDPLAANGTMGAKVNVASVASLDEIESQSIDLQLREIRNRIEQLQLPYFDGATDQHE